MNIQVQQQQRKSLAFKLTPNGAIVLVPFSVDANSQEVKTFIDKALAKLPNEPMQVSTLQLNDIYRFVEDWQVRLQVKITRLQIRPMRNKWGSISTAGTLTLASELCQLPADLVEYVVVHELLHLKFPDHRKGWQVSMSMYLHDWREKEARLQHYIPARSSSA